VEDMFSFGGIAMIRLFVILFVTVMSMISAEANAKPTVDHPRLRLLIHGGSEIAPNFDGRVHIVPSTNLATGLTPYLYIGAGWKPLQWLDIESDVAWDFHNTETVLAFRPSVKFGDFWSWADLEFQIPSGSAYWYVQAQYRISDFIELGVEGEGWGKVGHTATWSHGVGPNVLLQFDKNIEVDIALQFRHSQGNEGGWGLDPFIRVHLFL